MKISIVYRDKDGQVEKEVIQRKDFKGDGVADNFHQNIIDTYYTLEQRGELSKMGGREKRAIRELHTIAQDARYWGE